jgi:hypothetical protein
MQFVLDRVCSWAMAQLDFVERLYKSEVNFLICMLLHQAFSNMGFYIIQVGVQAWSELC